MQTVAAALGKLQREIEDGKSDGGAVSRVLRWTNEVYGRLPNAAGKTVANAAGATTDEDTDSFSPQADETAHFADLASLYNAAAPETDIDRALVGGYFIQFVQGQSDFGSQNVNAELKNLGHGVNNITSAFDGLKGQRPSLVMQVRKEGTTKQARKKYRLTTEGRKAVELMTQRGR